MFEPWFSVFCWFLKEKKKEVCKYEENALRGTHPQFTRKHEVATIYIEENRTYPWVPRYEAGSAGSVKLQRLSFDYSSSRTAKRNRRKPRKPSENGGWGTTEFWHLQLKIEGFQGVIRQTLFAVIQWLGVVHQILQQSMSMIRWSAIPANTYLLSPPGKLG